MSDLISRSALIEALRKDKESVYSHVFCHTECQFEDDLANDLEQMINNQPTIEAVPLAHGMYIKITTDDFNNLEWAKEHGCYREHYFCTTCNTEIGIKTFNRERQFGQWSILQSNDFPHFCPNCGADMRKGGAE